METPCTLVSGTFLCCNLPNGLKRRCFTTPTKPRFAVTGTGLRENPCGPVMNFFWLFLLSGLPLQTPDGTGHA